MLNSFLFITAWLAALVVSAVRAEPMSVSRPWLAPAGSPQVGDCERALDRLPFSSDEKTKIDLSESEWMVVDQAFAACLGEYIQIKSINPPGDEHKAVAFWAQVFDHLQIPHYEFSGAGRANLVADLVPPAAAKKPSEFSIVLYHHTDVVPVFSEQWQRPEDTFSGAIHENFIWGRGAIDMKSIGVMQMLSMALIKRQKVKFDKTIRFVAAADEEVGTVGVETVLREMQSGGLPNVGTPISLLNEGGYGVHRRGRDFFAVSTEDKGGAWLRLSHRDPLALINLLDNSLQLLDIHNQTVWQKNSALRHCKINQFSTIGEQQNVMPSKITLALNCGRQEEAVQRQLREAFNNEAARALSARVALNPQADGNYFIRIELPTAGHGALAGRSALSVAAQGLQVLGIVSSRYNKIENQPSYYSYLVTPDSRDFLNNIFRLYKIPQWLGELAVGAPLLGSLTLNQIGELAYSERLFRTSCSWTGFQIKADGSAQALVDCRLVHTGFYSPKPKDEVQQFISEIQNRSGDPDLRIDLVKGWRFPSNRFDDRFLQAADERNMAIFHRELRADNPTALVTRYMTPASTDSAVTRAPDSVGLSIMPIPSYGFFPAVFDESLLATIHGSNERFPVGQIRPAIVRYSRVVSSLAQSNWPL